MTTAVNAGLHRRPAGAATPAAGEPPVAPRTAPVPGSGWLRLVLIAAVLLPAVTMGAIAWVGWRDAWSAAEREMSRSAEAGGEYALRVLEAQRLAIDAVNDLLRGLGDAEVRAREAELHAVLRARLPRMPLVQTIYVLDRDGRALLSANLHPVPRAASFADREWMQALAAPDAPAFHVSRIFVGRLERNVFFGASARREGTGNGLPENAFDGVVNVAVSPTMLAAGFAALGGEPGDVTALIRADGAILVRTPGVSGPLPMIPEGSPLHAAAAAGETRGTYMGRTLGLPPDQAGQTRLIAFRRVGDLPLYVTMARPTPVIIARWRDTVLRQLAIGVPTTLALIALAWLALHRAGIAEAAQAALRRAAAERVAGEARRAAEARFRGVFESRVVGMAVFDANTGETLLANDRVLEMTGSTRAAFDRGTWDWRRITPPEHLPRDDHAIAEARRRGWWEPYEKEYLHADGSRVPVRISSAPLPGEPGRVVVLIEDITERREAELRRELLLREVDHRAKNALASVRAALRLTRAPDLASFVREVDGRIGALSRAIRLLGRTRCEPVGSEAVPRGEKGHCLRRGAAPRVTLDGPALTIAGTAVQPLAMAMHELATNATKHGALSRHDGEVAIAWSLVPGSPPRLRLVWQERGGPPIGGAPHGEGFGLRVLAATLTRQLGGTVSQVWEPDGLTSEIRLPVSRVLVSGGAVSEPAHGPLGGQIRRDIDAKS